MKEFLKNNNFGKWGWGMIFYAAVSYYIAAAISTDGLNFYPAQFEMAHGWNAGLITTMAGILSQTVYGYSGLYVVLLVADVVAIIMTCVLIKTK